MDTQALLRHSLQALHSGTPDVQRPADAWLQDFRSVPGAWRVCLQLLDVPNLGDHECYFAANSIKATCQKQQDVLDPSIVPELLATLIRHLQACLNRQQWAPALQLAAGTATLAVRASCLQPSNLLQDLQGLLFPASAASAVAAAAAAASAAAAAAAAAAANNNLATPQFAPQNAAAAATAAAEAAGAAAVAAAAAAACSASSQNLGLHLQQDPVTLAAALLLLAAFPEAVLSKQTSVHPDRRTAVGDGLKHSSWPAPLLRAAFCSHNVKLVSLACDAVVSWCELGVPPRGFELQAEALDVLATALLGPETAVKACDAFAALLAACRESSGGSSSSSDPSMQLQQLLLQLLQASVLPALAAEYHSMGLDRAKPGSSSSSSSSSGSNCGCQQSNCSNLVNHAAAPAAAGAVAVSAASAGAVRVGDDLGPAYSEVVKAHLGVDAEAAFCRVLCAAAAGLLRPVLQGAVQLQSLLELLLQQLLLSVCATEDGVAMTAVDFWQESYLTTFQALPQEQQAALLVQQQGVLKALAAVLVQRTELSPAAAAAATADARDLPEEMRMVRRELASALRDIGSLLGPASMLTFICQLVSHHYEHLHNTHKAAVSSSRHAAAFTGNASSTSSGSASSAGVPVPVAAGLGLHGIAAGLAAGADVCGTTTVARWGAPAAVAAAPPAAAAAAAAVVPGRSFNGISVNSAGVGALGDWLPLESALYAANVVLGRQSVEAAAQQVQQLVQYAAASVAAPGGSLKLSGTALTLLGGLPSWFVLHQQPIPLVLSAAIAALKSPDDKLARNAATCIHRLTSCDDLAVLLTRSQPQFVHTLLQEYQSRGGLAARGASTHGDDKPTEELLLLSLCSLAVAHTSNSSDMDSILLQLVGPQLAAATDELTAAMHGKWPQPPPHVPAANQQQQLLHAAAAGAGGSMAHAKQQQQQQHLMQGRQNAQRQREQQQQQSSQLTSMSVSCFRALTNLVAGLPTGVTKHSLGVPVHGRHPRHHQQLQQQQQQHHHQQQAVQAGGVSQHHLAPASASAAAAAATADDTSMCSASVSDVSSSLMHSASGGCGGTGRCQGKCLHQQCSSPLAQHQLQQPLAHAQLPQQKQAQQSQQQQMAAASAATAKLRQHQACFIVSQLLYRASNPIMLAFQVAIKAAADEQQVTFAHQLLAAACNFLLVALPAAVQYQHALQASTVDSSNGNGSESSSSTMTGAAALGSSSGSPAAAAGSSTAGHVQPSVLLMQLCQLMQQLPLQLLQLSCCLQLLSSSVPAAAAVGVVPAAEQIEHVMASGSVQQLQQQMQLMSMLQGLVQHSLGAACTSILAKQGGADPDHTSAALALATVCMQQCPGLLATADMGSVLLMTLTATKTYHLKQCNAVLDWILVLLQVSYSSQLQQQHTQHQQALPAAAAASSSSSSSAAWGAAGTAALAATRQRLESGLGAQLVLALMLAAAGDMPPDVVLPISFCLHSVWLSVGQQLFETWLQLAVLQLAPEGAPWQRQRHAAKLTFISELTDTACLSDTTRFKRLVKNFCGGKKKGGGGGRAHG